MPQQIACPLCRNAIQYSSELAGTDVVCPHCSQTFQMPRLQAPGIAPHAKPPPPRQQTAAPPTPSTAGGFSGIAMGDAPTPYSAPHAPSAPRSEPRGLSAAAAKGRVQTPAIIMLVCAGLGCLGAALAAGQVVHIYATTDSHYRTYFMGRNADAILMIRALWGLVSFVVMGYAAFGSLQMMNLREYGLAKFAAIIMLIPLFGCCIFSVPFGIWSLVTLSDPDIRRAFRSGGGRRTRRYR